MDEILKLVSLIFTGLGIFAGAFASVFPEYTSVLAATAAGCGGVSALCQKTLSGGQPAVPAVPAPAAAPAPRPAAPLPAQAAPPTGMPPA